MTSPPKQFENLNDDLVSKIIKKVLKHFNEYPRTSQTLGNTSKSFRNAVRLIKPTVLHEIIPTSKSFKNEIKLLLENKQPIQKLSASKIKKTDNDFETLRIAITHINNYAEYYDDDTDEQILGYLADYSEDRDDFETYLHHYDGDQEEIQTFATNARNRIIEYCEELFENIKNTYEKLVSQDHVYIYKLGALYYMKVKLQNAIGNVPKKNIDAALVKSIDFHKAYLTSVLTNNKLNKNNLILIDTIAFIGNYNKIYKFPSSQNYKEDKTLTLYMHYMYYYFQDKEELKKKLHDTLEKLRKRTSKQLFELPKNSTDELKLYEKCVEYFLQKHPKKSSEK